MNSWKRITSSNFFIRLVNWEYWPFGIVHFQAIIYWLIAMETRSTWDQQADSGIFYGRFDLRCESLEALFEGRINVQELNGCGAEPTHIYDPDYSLLKAMITQLVHWRHIYEIAYANKSYGVKFASQREAWHFISNSDLR